MNQNTLTPDYAAPDTSELGLQRRGGIHDNLNPTKVESDPITRAVARRLLSACIIVPGVLWFVMIFGVNHHWYRLPHGSLLFACSVTAVMGAIIWFNVMKLTRMDAQKAQVKEQLRLAKEAAEAANRFKSMFFANISHEIRTPLTAINGFADLVLNSERTPEQRHEDARIIRRNGEHLLTLINDIMDMSKIEAGQMSVERIPCSPAAIVGEVISMLRARAAEKNLKLDVSFEGIIPKTIRTDPTRLRQMLINLTANAVKFTKEGSVRLSVTIKPDFHAENPQLEVRITDTGIGIPPEQQASLFKAFAQGDASITRHYGGSGLGLAISRSFARALDGDIVLSSSEPGLGSTFTVTVGAGSLAGVGVQDDLQQAMKPQDNFAGPRVRIEGSVLVAEDGLDNQALIAAKLRETGLNVEIVADGKLCWEAAMAALKSDTPFDLILMDVQMPVMDGYTSTLKLRSMGYRGPIIALTANASERDRTRCLNAGCNDFVTKPINMEALFKAMGRYLTVVEVAEGTPRVPAAAAAAAKPVSNAVTNQKALAQKFYQDLPNEIANLEQALEREDRVRLKEIAQLLLGKIAAAGLKSMVPQAVRLYQAFENEKSWNALLDVVVEFARECKADTPRQAA